MRRLPPARLFLLLLVGSVSLLASHRAGATGPTSVGVDRAVEPVVFTGEGLPSFLKAPVSNLFVYAFKAGAWSQIPYQIDEVGSDGLLAATGDGLFDRKDQLVFMAQDLGEQAGAAEPPGGGPWYQIEVTDPLDSAAKGYAYVVRSSSLRQTFTADYVRFDAANRIVGATYQLGFNASGSGADAWFSYLSLADTTNILDRTPKLVGCAVVGANSTICLNEEDLKGAGLKLIKDGPVRVIVRGGGPPVLVNEVLAYAGMVAGDSTVNVPVPPTVIRYSTDFNPNASGATFYNSVTPAGGVTIDGMPDSVGDLPFSPWWQVSSSHGTLVDASDVTPVGGTPHNYYQDDKTPCTTTKCDTGDMMHYGDTGVLVTNPNNVFPYPYRFNFYFLPPDYANVGSKYAQYFAHPLEATGQFHPGKVYLPLITAK